ncbi:hypothetical protein B0H19DRAFT_1266646 [Mycena capillaripes]|nr:hypothetical protein B0H19DRAFT_1266646 [Mycena capillaripes]
MVGGFHYRFIFVAAVWPFQQQLLKWVQDISESPDCPRLIVGGYLSAVKSAAIGQSVDASTLPSAALVGFIGRAILFCIFYIAGYTTLDESVDPKTFMEGLAFFSTKLLVAICMRIAISLIGVHILRLFSNPSLLDWQQTVCAGAMGGVLMGFGGIRLPQIQCTNWFFVCMFDDAGPASHMPKVRRPPRLISGPTGTDRHISDSDVRMASTFRHQAIKRQDARHTVTDLLIHNSHKDATNSQ